MVKQEQMGKALGKAAVLIQELYSEQGDEILLALQACEDVPQKVKVNTGVTLRHTQKGLEVHVKLSFVTGRTTTEAYDLVSNEEPLFEQWTKRPVDVPGPKNVQEG